MVYSALFSRVSYTGREKRKERLGKRPVKEAQHVTLANRANMSVSVSVSVSVPSQDPVVLSQRRTTPPKSQEQPLSRKSSSPSKTLLDPSGSCHPIIACDTITPVPDFPVQTLILYFLHLNLLVLHLYVSSGSPIQLGPVAATLNLECPQTPAFSGPLGIARAVEFHAGQPSLPPVTAHHWNFYHTIHRLTSLQSSPTPTPP
jgi:hypothetical protein